MGRELVSLSTPGAKCDVVVRRWRHSFGKKFLKRRAGGRVMRVSNVCLMRREEAAGVYAARAVLLLLASP